MLLASRIVKWWTCEELNLGLDNGQQERELHALDICE